jgi:uncharacterized membrane protein
MQRVESSIRVAAPVSKVYEYWRNFENFPHFMQYVEEVRKNDAEGRMSHWRIKGPLGMSVEFDARLTQDEPNRSIGWNSIDGSVETTGNVTFSETDNNTLVHVVLNWYDPPGGAVGEAAAKVLYNPATMLDEDLKRFKDIVEGRATSRRVA